MTDVLVVGGTRGLGLEIAKVVDATMRAREITPRIFVAGRTWKPPYNSDIIAGSFSVDLSSEQGVERLVSKIRTWGPTPIKLPYVFWTVGLNLIKPTWMMGTGDLQELMQVNAYSLIQFVKLLHEDMYDWRTSIQVVGSNAPDRPGAHSLAYAMSKGAQEVAVRSLARDFGPLPTLYTVKLPKFDGTDMSTYISAQFALFHHRTPKEQESYELASSAGGVKLSVETVAKSLVNMHIWDGLGQTMNGSTVKLGYAS